MKKGQKIKRVRIFGNLEKATVIPIKVRVACWVHRVIGFQESCAWCWKENGEKLRKRKVAK